MIPRASLGTGSTIPITILPDADAVISRFADDILAEYVTAKQAGREKVVFILPVGPVGQYDIIAKRCNDEGNSLKDLVIVCMDEFLNHDGTEFIDMCDPLSFRGHMERHFFARLNPKLAPPSQQIFFPDPKDLSSVPKAIERFGGTDVCFGGIGINGHIAFNDPPEPGEEISLEEFKQLPTRTIRLSRETRLINAVTVSRGNVERIPEFAVTIGMKEILSSRKVRIYMHRLWHSAIVRKALHGPMTPAVPASLLQDHADVNFTIADYVAELPEPKLQ